MRRATLVLLLSLAGLVGCNDVRDFEGVWRGTQVGESPVLRVGVPPDASAALTIDGIDRHGLHGQVSVAGLVEAVPFTSVEGAEADVLAGMSFGGSPLRVYLAFVPVPDDGGDALAVISLYEDQRVELRLLRGGARPVYAIFALTSR